MTSTCSPTRTGSACDSRPSAKLCCSNRRVCWSNVCTSTRCDDNPTTVPNSKYEPASRPLCAAAPAHSTAPSAPAQPALLSSVLTPFRIRHAPAKDAAHRALPPLPLSSHAPQIRLHPTIGRLQTPAHPRRNTRRINRAPSQSPRRNPPEAHFQAARNPQPVSSKHLLTKPGLLDTHRLDK
jgi:hypothetical protein